MKKQILYNDIEKILCVFFPFTPEHKRTLLAIKNNNGSVCFENREIGLTDMDGNDISWKICDELVEMGLLEEDEESFDVFFELTDDGKEIIEQL